MKFKFSSTRAGATFECAATRKRQAAEAKAVRVAEVLQTEAGPL